MSASALAIADTLDEESTALPVIDLSEFDATGDRAVLHQRLARIARDTGFFYLEGHGIDVAQIRELERLTRETFQHSPEAKDRIAIRNTPHFRGYTGVGGEITRLKPDLREQLDFGEELPAVTSSDPDHPIWWSLQGPNQWPAELPDLKPAVLDWLDKTRAVA